MYYLTFLNKWLHLFSITGVLGGILFGLLVLAPGLRATPDGEETGKEIWKRFGMILGMLWIVALLTGFLNLYLVTPKVNSHYQMIAGIKMLLAVLMFVLSLRAVQRFFPSRTTWLTVLAVMGVLILGISANLNLSRINGRGLKHVAKSAAKVGKGTGKAATGAMQAPAASDEGAGTPTSGTAR